MAFKRKDRVRRTSDGQELIVLNVSQPRPDGQARPDDRTFLVCVKPDDKGLMNPESQRIKVAVSEVTAIAPDA